MTHFSYMDYLNVLEHSSTKTTGATSAKVLGEIQQLRNHKANLSTMQKHLRNFKTLKNLVENYGLNFF